MNVRVNSFRSPQGGHIGTRRALRFADLGAAVGCKNAFCMCLRRQSTGLGTFGHVDQCP